MPRKKGANLIYTTPNKYKMYNKKMHNTPVVHNDSNSRKRKAMNTPNRTNYKKRKNYQISDSELSFSSLLNCLNSTQKGKTGNSSSTLSNEQFEDLFDAHETYDVHQGLIELYKKLSPTPEGHAARVSIINDVRTLVNRTWPLAVVEVFGSFPTGLYLPDGDLDLVIFGNWRKETNWNSSDSTLGRKIYHCLTNELRLSHFVKKNSVQFISNAKVPIVKFEDTRYNISVDISFNIYDGMAGCVFLKKTLVEYPCLRILIILLKQFLAERKLNRVYKGGISSYTLYMMIISFLQLHPRTNILRTNNEVNIAVLLIDFFDLYGRKFNFQNVCISVQERKYKTRSEFYKKYKLINPSRPSICVEDPCHLGSDIGRGSFCIEDITHCFLKAKNDLVNLLLKKS